MTTTQRAMSQASAATLSHAVNNGYSSELPHAFASAKAPQDLSKVYSLLAADRSYRDTPV